MSRKIHIQREHGKSRNSKEKMVSEGYNPKKSYTSFARAKKPDYGSEENTFKSENI